MIRQRKHEREAKRQRGQYMTPPSLATKIIDAVPLDTYKRILEPACGGGVFLSAIVDRLSTRRLHEQWELIGVEVDNQLAQDALTTALHCCSDRSYVRARICNSDFFRAYLAGMSHDTCNGTISFDHGSFDLVIGNPPFGGTFHREIEDVLDRRLGRRLGMKIKKETYAFFIVACVDLLRPNGRLTFICSDTLLTIPTMAGLRNFLMKQGDVTLTSITEFSAETNYPMVVLDFVKNGNGRQVVRDAEVIEKQAILATPNLSWGVDADTAHFFDGPLLGDRFIATSGMTTGNNSLFVRNVCKENQIQEPFEFEFYQAPVTLKYELDRARLGRLPARRRAALKAAEEAGRMERRVRIVRRDTPDVIAIPDSRYAPYNKANGRIVYSNPTHFIYWEDEGDAVLTYKRTGNWYLRGIGGQRFFRREGITWQLVATQFVPRYLPEGYILDSGAPCAFLQEAEDRDDLYFVLGWLLSDTANRILKTVVNHTRNIQSKDFERMPYPWWVSSRRRAEAILTVREMIEKAQEGKVWSRTDDAIRRVGKLFEWTRRPVRIGPSSPASKRAGGSIGGSIEDLFGYVE